MRDRTYYFYTQRLGLNWWITVTSALHKFSICIPIELTLLNQCIILKVSDEVELPELARYFNICEDYLICNLFDEVNLTDQTSETRKQ